MPKISNKHLAFLICLLLALTTIAAYWQLRHNEFINFDDHLYITDNQHVKNGLTWQGLVWAFTSTHAYNWHPLTWISHMLDGEFYGSAPGGHHFTNVIFHAANAILLFLVIRRLTGALWPSAFVAAVFALHPLHVESVAWASERKDVLSTFFWFLTTWAYARYVARPVLTRYLLIILFFALGLLAKQMLVTLPFVLLLLDYWPLRRLNLKAGGSSNSLPTPISVSIRRCVLEKLPLFVLSAVASVVVFLVQERTVVMKSLIEYPLPSRLANALAAYTIYIGKMLWPGRLAIFYPHLGDKLLTWQLTAAAVLLIVITALVIWKCPRYPYLAVGWFWYLGTLVPVIGLVQVGEQALADRYTYIPLIGLFIIIAWGLPDLLTKWRYAETALSVSAVIVLLALSVCTRVQLHHWRNSITLFGHAIHVTDRNYVAHCNLAEAIAKQGNLPEAIRHYRRALQFNPHHAGVHNNLGIVLRARGKTDEAISHYREALRLSPNFAEAHNSLANALAARRKFNEAIHHYRQALRTKRNNATVHNNLANVLLSQRKLDEAIHHYHQALLINPNYANAHNNLALALQSKGKLDQAISHYRQALQINPNHTQARNALTALLQKTHEE